MAYETITYEVRDDVARITLNRPEVLNAIADEMHEELKAALNRADADPGARGGGDGGGAGWGFCAEEQRVWRHGVIPSLFPLGDPGKNVVEFTMLPLRQ